MLLSGPGRRNCRPGSFSGLTPRRISPMIPLDTLVKGVFMKTTAPIKGRPRRPGGPFVPLQFELTAGERREIRRAAGALDESMAAFLRRVALEEARKLNSAGAL